MTTIAPIPSAMAAAVAAPMTAHVARVGEVELFYLDAPGGAPPVVLLHGLSANAHSFGGIIAAGLAPAHRVVAPDLRGRARSSKPATGYTMADHARDVIALLDALHLQRVILGGHSFGGYLAIYVAANFPERVERLVVIDAAVTTQPRIAQQLKPSLDRLTRTAPSVEAYLAEVRGAAYLAGEWDASAEQYYRAEVVENPDGTARSATSAGAIGEASFGLACEPWLHHIQAVRAPVLLLNALGDFGPPGSPPLMDAIHARATARAFRDARYVVVPGNHLTMLFGTNAAAISREIERFAGDGTPSGEGLA